MIFAGITAQGVECVRNARARHDGDKRNPWDEEECGHHHARAMSAWSTLLAIGGFRHHGGERAVTIAVTIKAAPDFRSFWKRPDSHGRTCHASIRS
jgi:hypothetical protein